MKSPPFLIVWDLDHTIGVFDAMERVASPQESVTVHLRPGIAETLDRLTAEGFAHTILTLASRSYAEVVLRGVGLRQHFLEVKGIGERPKGDARGIARTFGIDPDECHRQMLFVGDHPLFDVPQDPRVVFHFEPYPLRRPAAAVAALALMLRYRGAGSLRAGFDAVSGLSGPGPGLTRVAVDGVGRLLMAQRADGCPIVAFDEPEPPRHSAEVGTPVTFVPSAVAAAAR